MSSLLLPSFHPLVHGFVEAVYVVMEGNRLDTRFQLNVKGGTTNFPGALNIQGTITAVASGTASEYNIIPIISLREPHSRVGKLFGGGGGGGGWGGGTIRG